MKICPKILQNNGGNSMQTLKEKLQERLKQLRLIPLAASSAGVIMGACTSGCAASCSGCRGCGSGCSSVSPCPRR